MLILNFIRSPSSNWQPEEVTVTIPSQVSIGLGEASISQDEHVLISILKGSEGEPTWPPTKVLVLALLP